MNVLVISTHMDDEVLGCGGSIIKHVESGDDVYVCFIAHRIYDHKFDKDKNEVEKQHAGKAKEALGYKDLTFFDLNDERLDASVQDIIIPLEKYVSKIMPDTVYSPFYGDNNQDHRATFDAARVALRPSATPFINNIYMYEVPSSTEQSPPLQEIAFSPNYYVDISGCVDRKLEAYRCYETETRHYPHPRSEEALKVLSKKRGTEIGFKFAEAFVVSRKKWC